MEPGPGPGQGQGQGQGSGSGRWAGTACVVTGASRGFGRSLARILAPQLGPGSAMLLLARSADALEELASELRAGATGSGTGGDTGGDTGSDTRNDTRNGTGSDTGGDTGSGTGSGDTELRVQCVAADLGCEEGLQRASAALRELLQDASFGRLLLLNNAGSLGDVSRSFQELSDLQEINSYLCLNVSSALFLTSAALRAFGARAGGSSTVVNISSLCARQPFPSWALYCAAKAARDMMFRVLAAEQPGIRVLSYAPGPLDTDMQLLARTRTADLGLRQHFQKLQEQGQLIPSSVSAQKLLQLLQEDSFPSGAHVDFYDV